MITYHCDCKLRRATIESTLSNTRHTLGDGNRGQRMATIESIVSYTGYTVGDNNGG